jgi:GDP/UDP-N,N'-diacetylbacillosamine 2-epimerase (hydrolysing)
MEKLRQASFAQLQILASCMHLSHEFGMTYKTIANDGFDIDETVEILLSSDTSVAICKSMGLALIGFSEALQRLTPDLLVILGDRYDAFSAASAAMITRIPIAHLHGGEATYGLIDEAIRHSITKMSHLHFAATEAYRNRIIQLGEHPEHVFNVGAIGIDNIRSMDLLEKEALERELGFHFNQYNVLLTFHPVTLETNTAQTQFQNVLCAIDKRADTNIIFTKCNADTDGRVINAMIDDYVRQNGHKSKAFTSMGQKRYLSAMKYVDAVVGNSSSGIIEAPTFKIGTLNVGDRQKGRLQADSVIQCDPEIKSIDNGLSRLFSEDFQKQLQHVKNPYGEGGTAAAIMNVLRHCDLKNIIKKEFYDLDLSAYNH